MPEYEYVWKKCGKTHSEFHRVSEWRGEGECPFCGANSKQIISTFNVSSFKSQVVVATLTDKDGSDVNQYVRNKRELKDAINRFNDTERASKTGRVAVL
jgi:putative FmdB family regulatory protein